MSVPAIFLPSDHVPSTMPCIPSGAASELPPASGVPPDSGVPAPAPDPASVAPAPSASLPSHRLHPLASWLHLRFLTHALPLLLMQR